MFKNFKVDNAKREEFTGSLATIAKSKEAYLRGLKINGAAASSFNITVCGKNIFNYNTALHTGQFLDESITKTDGKYTAKGRNDGVNRSFISSSDGLIRIGTSSLGIPSSNGYYLPAGTYTVNFKYKYLLDGGKSTGLGIRVLLGGAGLGSFIFDTDSIFSTSLNTEYSFTRTFNLSQPTSVYLMVYLNACRIDFFDIQIVSGSYTAQTLPPYQPYNGQTYPYRLEDTNGTLRTLSAGDYYDRDNNIAALDGEIVNIKPFSAGFQYNAKPIQIAGECNIFTDTGAEMNFKAVSY